jgi:hypothetical protein
MRRLMFLIPGLLLMGVLLAACGGSGITQTAETDSYTVQLALDDTRFGERTATITVSARSGGPAQVDQVVIAPLMESMGMVTPEQAAQALGDGRYQAKGEFFTMLGEWEVDVRISRGGSDEVARFKVPVTTE